MILLVSPGLYDSFILACPSSAQPYWDWGNWATITVVRDQGYDKGELVTGPYVTGKSYPPASKSLSAVRTLILVFNLAIC